MVDAHVQGAFHMEDTGRERGNSAVGNVGVAVGDVGGWKVGAAERFRDLGVRLSGIFDARAPVPLPLSGRKLLC